VSDLTARAFGSCIAAAVLAASLYAMSTGSARSDQGSGMPFQTRFTVDLKKYVGLWYEAARTPNSFEDNTPRRRGERYSACFNATAAYELAGPGRIRIRNVCTREAPSGATYQDEARGVGVVTTDSSGRKLKIAFGPAIGRFFMRLVTGGGANYWIYCLGPENAEGLYDWAVISGPKRDMIFVLTRTKSLPSGLKSEILACARSEGLPVDKLIYRQR
jgi:apolipoprotein D and lipocalin family protein